jgi:putative tryptophan/tyrosine transport system substrate-binding protein
MIRRRNFVTGALALAAVPFAARAQQVRTARIALASPGNVAEDMVEGGQADYAAFLVEMRRLGYQEGVNLVVERHGGRGRADPYVSLAREIVASQPDVIVARSTPLIAALKAATTTIPIVASINDPVASGLVASLARPGGNITAFTGDAGPELHGKVLELLRDSVPGASRLAYLESRALWEGPGGTMIRAGVERLGATLVPVIIDPPLDERAYREAFALIARERVDAVYVGNASENIAAIGLIAELAYAARLPGSHLFSAFPRAGGLMSYGPDLVANWRGMAGYVDRILKGQSPATLPVQLPREFHFVVNLKTARSLGLTIPERMLAIATEVIE